MCTKNWRSLELTPGLQGKQLSHYTTRLLYIFEINLDIVDKYQALTYSKHYGEQGTKDKI